MPPVCAWNRFGKDLTMQPLESEPESWEVGGTMEVVETRSLIYMVVKAEAWRKVWLSQGPTAMKSRARPGGQQHPPLQSFVAQHSPTPQAWDGRQSGRWRRSGGVLTVAQEECLALPQKTANQPQKIFRKPPELGGKKLFNWCRDKTSLGCGCWISRGTSGVAVLDMPSIRVQIILEAS